MVMIGVLVLRVMGQQDWIEGAPNLSPLMALAFAGTVLIPRPLPWWSWAVFLLGADALSQGRLIWAPANLPVILLTYACYVLAAWWGGRMRKRGAGVVNTLGGTLVCSALFFLVTNTFSWVVSPLYAKTFEGWVQALTIGTPGPWPPTLVFFRNSLIADLAGACVLLMAYNGEAILRGARGLPWIGGKRATVATA
jgi:hypothetical protein